MSAVFDGDLVLDRISRLPRADRWQALARSALRDDLYTAVTGLTADVLASTEPASAPERIAAWQQANALPLAQAQGRLEEIDAHVGDLDGRLESVESRLGDIDGKLDRILGLLDR